MPASELPRFGSVMLERGHLFLPIALVLFGLIQGYSAPLCALVGALSCLPIALLRKTTRAGISWRNVLEALEEGAKNTLAVAMACAVRRHRHRLRHDHRPRHRVHADRDRAGAGHADRSRWS